MRQILGVVVLILAVWLVPQSTCEEAVGNPVPPPPPQAAATPPPSPSAAPPAPAAVPAPAACAPCNVAEVSSNLEKVKAELAVCNSNSVTLTKARDALQQQAIASQTATAEALKQVETTKSLAEERKLIADQLQTRVNDFDAKNQGLVKEIQVLSSQIKTSTAELEARHAKDIAARDATIQELKSSVASQGNEKDILTKTIKSKDEELAGSNQLVAKLRAEHKQVLDELNVLKEELKNIDATVFSKDKFMSVSASLWTVGKSLWKNSMSRVRSIIGDARYDSILDMTHDAFSSGCSISSIYYYKVSDVVVNYYDAYLAKTTVSLSICKYTSNLADHIKAESLKLWSKFNGMIESRLDNTIRRLSTFEPDVQTIMPEGYVDRVFAAAFVGTHIYLFLNLVGYLGNTVLDILSLVICCRVRRSSTKSAKKKKSSSGTLPTNTSSKVSSKPGVTASDAKKKTNVSSNGNAPTGAMPRSNPAGSYRVATKTVV